MSISNRVPRSLIATALLGALVIVPAITFAKDGGGNDNGQGNGKGLALGQIIKADIKDVVHKLGSEISVQINDNGKVLVRGAQVTSVNGGTIVASTNFGSTTVSWTLNTNGSTQFVNVKGKNTGLSTIALGDIVSFNGSLVNGASSLTVTATVVKDWSKSTTPAPTPAPTPVGDVHTFEGTFGNLSSTTLPATFTLAVGTTTYTVNVPVGTAVLNKNWATTAIGSFVSGDDVRVYGTAEASTTAIIDAVVVRDTAR